MYVVSKKKCARRKLAINNIEYFRHYKCIIHIQFIKNCYISPVNSNLNDFIILFYLFFIKNILTVNSKLSGFNGQHTFKLGKK
jgi:hypothetical protein